MLIEQIKGRAGLLCGLVCCWVGPTVSPALENSPVLIDVAPQVGVDFVHFNGMTGRLYYVETMGAGGALFDYDNDGDLDLYLVQGTLLGADRKLSDSLVPWPENQPLRDRLFRNDLKVNATGTPVLHFTEVTLASNIRSFGYGIGAAVGDIDNDGYVDLYVLNFGANQLWRNLGDGTFVEATDRYGLADEGFSVAASFTDIDGDQDLDLYITNYLDFSLATNKSCLTDLGEKDYCGPTAYRPQPDRLLLNETPGPFRVARSALGRPAAGMGVIAADFDRNRVVDFYVANDLDPNQLLLGQRSDDGIRYTDDALLYGVALNKDGEAEASMGLDAADFDGDGDLDLFSTHFRRESNTLYAQNGDGFFVDVTEQSGLSAPSWQHTAFGTRFVDIDSDGDLDLLIANGAVTFHPGEDRKDNPFPLNEANQLFLNDGGHFFDASTQVGGDFLGDDVSRSLLSGDLDNDGDTDIVVTNNSGPTQILRNDFPRPETTRWIGLDFRLGADHGERPALGAQVIFDQRGPNTAQPLAVRVHNDGSYASASDHRLIRTVAVGQEPPVPLSFTVTWPDSVKERFKIALPVQIPGRYQRVLQGTGAAILSPATPGQP